MDFVFRCNSLDCRALLRDVAVVTTCSHIYCTACAESRFLSEQASSERYCPACRTVLDNSRDAVITNLKPTEDYKASILSGLTPSVIMECAGRALHFYAYQVSQEIVYQEYIGKGIADKCSTLGSYLDKVIIDANSEVIKLRSRVSSLDHEKQKIQSALSSFQSDYDEKCRALQKLQKEHDALKGRVSVTSSMAAASSAVVKQIDSKRGYRYDLDNSVNAQRGNHTARSWNDHEGGIQALPKAKLTAMKGTFVSSDQEELGKPYTSENPHTNRLSYPGTVARSSHSTPRTMNSASIVNDPRSRADSIHLDDLIWH